MEGLAGKTVIVTGASSGMGLACATMLAANGCSVMMADINREAGEAAAAQIRADGRGQAAFLSTDISNEAEVRALVDTAEKQFGKVDGAVNAAAIPPQGRLLADVTTDAWDRAYAINLRGMFFCVKYQIQAMQRAGGGSIVVIASTGAVQGLPNHSEYCATKAGVTGLVRSGAVEYGPQNIRINSILPGPILTPMLQGVLDTQQAARTVAEATLLKRFGQPREIAGAAAWLISDLSSFVTGVSLPVDGGLTAI